MLLPVILAFLLHTCAGISNSLMSSSSFDCTAAEAGNIRIVKELESATTANYVDEEASEGRLEVCLDYLNSNDTYFWGTVCDDNFDDEDAYYICKTFTKDNYGYEYGNGKAYGRDTNTLWKVGAEDQQYYLDEMDCPSPEEDSTIYWWECGYSGKASSDKMNLTDSNGTIVTTGRPDTNCNHKEDVFISCSEVLECYTCGGTSYDDCSANEMTTTECSKEMNTCFRKVERTYAGEMKVRHGCMAELNCDDFDEECAADDDNEYCYCNSCSETKCNSLFQIMMSDFGSFAVYFGELVEWMISNFTLLMRMVLFDKTAF